MIRRLQCFLGLHARVCVTGRTQIGINPVAMRLDFMRYE